MKTNIQNKKCENCGSLITQCYGSGRFCCEKCARSFATRKNRRQISKKVSSTLRNKYATGELSAAHQPARGKAGGRKNHLLKMARMVKSKNGDILNVSYQQLEEYRLSHPVCEICGRKYATNLCIDHDHNTHRFRGLLCSQCNRSLGWYEKQRENILKYLAR